MLLRIVSGFLAILLTSIIIFQVIIPAWNDQNLFPFFRSSWRRANRMRRKVRDDMVEARISLETTKESLSVIETKEAEALAFDDKISNKSGVN